MLQHLTWFTPGSYFCNGLATGSLLEIFANKQEYVARMTCLYKNGGAVSCVEGTLRLMVESE